MRKGREGGGKTRQSEEKALGKKFPRPLYVGYLYLYVGYLVDPYVDSKETQRLKLS